MKIDPIVKEILEELKFNPSECLWEKHGATCMKHRYIEIAGQEKGVVIESLDEVEKNSAEGVVAIKCTASLGKAKVITYGEATPKNNKNGYPYAMAEKRAVDRAILKLIGIHGFVYSDDEVNESMVIETSDPVPKLHIVKNKKNIDDLYITTALDKIKNNKEKKNSTVLRSEMENLKTEIHQSMGWDAFTKTEKFKTFNALKNQILKQKRS
jgi:hypothetical protein|tara:strand:- start:2183 stop:2815 length:633 start_codon:yes stop_codon:yes gene_type:complete